MKFFIIIISAVIWFNLITVLVCDEGYYGYDCGNTCSGHCLNSSPCNKQTCHCDKGCNSGYSNSDCSRSNLTDEWFIKWYQFHIIALMLNVSLKVSYLYMYVDSFFSKYVLPLNLWFMVNCMNPFLYRMSTRIFWNELHGKL